MTEHERKNLEELLSSYIDGELSERQCNEVKRLIAHNEQAAKLLAELQKYKALLGSLPRAQAPAHLFENVRASLERSVLLDEYHGKASAKVGAVHLFARKMAAAAAMIALVGVLGFVIYNIVKPEAKPAVDVAKMFPAAVTQPAVTSAKMELELQTDQATAVNAFIYRNIILDNGLKDNVTIDRLAEKNVYSISCSRARAGMILEELGTIWDKFKETKLSVEGVDLPIENVTARQAIEIAKEISPQEQILLARNFAAANKISAEQPGKEAIASADDKGNTDITITKPALTSGQAKAGPNEPANTQKISLAIVVTGQ
jgi:hypothetical protein